VTNVVNHKPSLHYLLNTLSIHNYEHIHSLLPESLRKTPLRVTDPEAVRKAAVKQMQSKRLAKKSGGAATDPTDEELHGTTQPAFDHGSKKRPKPTSTGKPPKSASTGKQPQRPVPSSSCNADQPGG